MAISSAYALGRVLREQLSAWCLGKERTRYPMDEVVLLGILFQETVFLEIVSLRVRGAR
ncbi:MAG: hypothetical protein AAF680_09960 [Pseudomonadota bacterium]